MPVGAVRAPVLFQFGEEFQEVGRAPVVEQPALPRAPDPEPRVLSARHAAHARERQAVEA